MTGSHAARTSSVLQFLYLNDNYLSGTIPAGLQLPDTLLVSAHNEGLQHALFLCCVLVPFD